jgi:hypothetical protein
LYTLDVGPFLRAFSIVLLRDKSTTSIGGLRDGGLSLLGAFVTPTSKEAAGLCSVEDARENLNRFTSQALDLGTLSVTPYPSLLLSYYMAAIGSVEGGVEIINSWLLKDKYPERRDTQFQFGWYEVRAMLAASQLPFLFGNMTPTHASLVRFQKRMTDQMGKLLAVRGAKAWKAFCGALSKKDMHSRLGRRLAFIYASERFYLFENLGPQDFITSVLTHRNW